MFCWFFRLMISHAADGNSSLSAITQKHVSRCAGCREFHEACLSLGEGLRREAPGLDEEFSSRLHERIASAVPGQRPETYKLVIKWRPVIAAACVAVLASIGILLLTRSEKVPDSNRYAEGKKIIYELVGEELLEAWPESVGSPLADEVENLTRDTESAVRFLVACVAVDPTETGNESIN
jgi:hypothetical protein